MKLSRTHALRMALTLAAAAAPGSAAAQYCTPISSLPYTITVPGVYCLTQSFSTTISFGSAIYVSTGSVVVGRITNPNNYGLFLENSPTTRYRDNLVSGAFQSYAGGTDAGNNN